jgi:site-specific DNA-methyltransferase (adenine-specific)
VLRTFPEAFVDLVYLDPPFNSNASYNILFKAPAGAGADANIEAFRRHLDWGPAASAALLDITQSGNHKLHVLMQAMKTAIGENAMMAYLAMMAARLVELHRVLKPTGSLYLHCDPHREPLPQGGSGRGVWGRVPFGKRGRMAKASARSVRQLIWPRLHDIIFYYGKGSSPTFRSTSVRSGKLAEPHDLVRWSDGLLYRTRDLTGAGTRRGETGLPWRGVDVTSKSRHWRVMHGALDQIDSEGRIHWQSSGMPRERDKLPYVPEERTAVVGDVWTDVPAINAGAQERLGYPTPEADCPARSGSSPLPPIPGDLVLDPFCGCGTAIDAAQKLGPQLDRHRHHPPRHRPGRKAPERGYNRTGSAMRSGRRWRAARSRLAQRLAADDPHQFQHWITLKLGGYPWMGGQKGGTRASTAISTIAATAARRSPG